MYKKHKNFGVCALVALAFVVITIAISSTAMASYPCPVLHSPADNTATTDHTITFGWYNMEGAEKYLLQVDNNPDFSSPEIEVYVGESQFKPKVPLTDDTYFWRVKVIDIEAHESNWSEAWTISIFILDDGITGVRVSNDLGIGAVQQHKDTGMLCLDGCPQTGPHRWDVDHGSRGCTHCDWYCARARISMIASHYGGSLSQDRISYQIFGGGNPEEDLGHGSGTTSAQTTSALSWALNGASSTHQSGKPTFNQIVGWINASRPLLWHRNGHAVVIDGYNTVGQLINVINPWTGSESSFAYSSYPCSEVWVPPATATARSDEASLSQDSDSDGIGNFDESERFKTNPNKDDTDGDNILDKIEIQSYTFDAARSPDTDSDGLRAEKDSDSDDGGVPDGCEDTNKNGVVDSGETDPFNKNDDLKLSASLSADSPVNSGDSFGVTMAVSNNGSAANNVAPSSLSVNTLTGDASATCGGHSPTSANIPGGSSQDFTWTCTASGEGTLKLSASASGTDDCTGKTVTASATTSNTVTVEVPEFLFGLVLPLMSSVLIYFSMRGRIKKR